MIKALKAICIITGLIFFLSLIAVLKLFEAGTISDIRLTVALGFLFSVLCVASRIGHWILCDHEKNVDWVEYLEDIAKSQ